MADYFLSDVHLRHDRPGRALRLAAVVDRMTPGDSLTVVGDLADFWLASRQRKVDPLSCPGLRSLAEFRSRGGRLTIMAGNHDAHLGPLYRTALGADWVAGDLTVSSHGLRVHLSHGHRLGARSRWKAALEGRIFLEAFGLLPGPVARRLERRLDRANEAGRAADDARHLVEYRRHADQLRGRADLVVLGHVHSPSDDLAASPRLIVLGGWHDRSSWLRIDDDGAVLRVIDPAGPEYPGRTDTRRRPRQLDHPNPSRDERDD